MKDKKVLAAAMITSFMTTFMSSALNLSIPTLESSFNVNAATISWVVSSYTITIAMMSLPMGKIADITSRRRMFLTGITGFSILCFACIWVRHIAVLLTLRALMGVCSAMIFATNNAILVSYYPPEIRGKVIGYSTAATYVGLTAGPVLGGILNSTFGWRSIFAVAVSVSALSLTAAIHAPSDDRRPAGSDDDAARGISSFDSPGVLLYIFSIGASLYGMTNLGKGPAPVVLLLAGLALLVVFFLHESRRESDSRDPVMKVSMFTGSRVFTFSSLAALLNYGATFAISYTISIYLQVIKGLPSSTAGLLLIVMPAMQALFSPLMGSLSDRVRPSILASSGMGVCVLTLILFSRLGEGTSIAYVLAALSLTGIGFALFSSPNTNAILSCVDRADYGVANSIVATMRTYGQSSGMAVLSIITVAVLGSGTLASSPAADILRMMHTAFLVFAAICLVGLFFSLARDSKTE